MASHDVQPFLRGLSAKLATRSRHVCVFLGAGASRACGLPDLARLDKQVLEGLDGEERDALVRLTLIVHEFLRRGGARPRKSPSDVG